MRAREKALKEYNRTIAEAQQIKQKSVENARKAYDVTKAMAVAKYLKAIGSDGNAKRS